MRGAAAQQVFFNLNYFFYILEVGNYAMSCPVSLNLAKLYSHTTSMVGNRRGALVNSFKFEACAIDRVTQEKQGANTCTVHIIIYGPVYACTTGKIRVPVSVTTSPSIPIMAQFYHGNYRIRIVYNIEDVTMCTRICD